MERDEPDLESIYRQFATAQTGDDLALLDESLEPRGPTLLGDIVAELGFGPEHLVLDVGCGTGHPATLLARQFAFRVVGLDRVPLNLRLAAETAAARGVAQLLRLLHGDITALPFRADSFDLVFCRDMLVHVRQVGGAIAQCARVLKPGGVMLVWTSVETDRMEPREASEVYRPQGIAAEAMSAAGLEAAFRSAGLQIERHELIGGETAEYFEETEGRASRELMRLARMLRVPERYRQRLGAQRYDVLVALYRWRLYHLLAKLSTAVYLLRKPAAARGR